MQADIIYISDYRNDQLEAKIDELAKQSRVAGVARDEKGLYFLLSQSVANKEVVIIAGEFKKGSSVCESVATMVGLSLEPVYNTQISFEELRKGKSNLTEHIPVGAKPFWGDNGKLFGCLVESGSQTIVMLWDESDAVAAFEKDVVPFLNEKYALWVEDIRKEIESVLEEDFSVGLPSSMMEPASPVKPPSKSFIEEEIDILLDDDLMKEEEPKPKKTKESLIPPYIKKETGARMKAKRKYVVLSLISIVLVMALALGGKFGYDWYLVQYICDTTYADLTLDYESYTGDGSELPEGMATKFGQLYHKNEDIAGWITIPNTKIDYPVVYPANHTKEYYGDHLFSGFVNRYGTLYFNDGYLSNTENKNMVIIGNNYSDGRMFGPLEQYMDLNFYQSSSGVIMDTIYEQQDWQVFGVVIVDRVLGENDFDIHQNEFANNQEFMDFVETINTRSIISTGVTVESSDRLLTLITPYSVISGLDVAVIAVNRDIESGNEILSGAALNQNAVYPLKWYEHYGIEPPEDLEDLLNGKNISSLIASKSRTNNSATDSASSGSSSSKESSGSSSSSSSSSLSTSSEEIAATDTSRKEAASSGETMDATTPSNSGGGEAANLVSGPAGDNYVPSANTSSAISDTGPTITVTNSFTGKVETGSAVSLIARVVEAEMGAGFHMEALKAQAVAAYTYLTYHGAGNGKAPGAPMKDATAKCLQAASEVVGQTIRYNGSLCNAVYSAMSAGRSCDSGDAWIESLPYLKSVDSSVDASDPKFNTTETYSAANIASWVKSQYGIDLQKVDKNQWFKVTYDANGLYASKVLIGGSQTVSGNQMRSNLFTSSRVGSGHTLRSHAYTISYNASDDSFTFAVKGYGHGCGMSQIGANKYAQQGWGYKTILTHYYSGVTVG